MCLTPDEPEVTPPAPPPEVLKQDAPEKKTANKKKAKSLSIGTKAYRNESGLGITAGKQKTRPTGPAISM